VMEMGPDGKMYAVGGEVKLDVSEVPGDPEATVRKMEQVRRAALAPLEPSPQDLRVAAIAAQEATEARIEAAREEPAEPGRTPPNFGLPVVDFAEVYFGNFDAFPAGNMVDLFA